MPALCLVLACALWGLSFPIVKALHLEQGARLPGASSEFLAAWMLAARFALAAVLLLPMVARMPRPTRSEMTQGLWLALWAGPGMGLQFDGLAYTSASTSAFLTQAYCVILPLWVALRGKQWPPFRVAGATVLVLVGGGILSGMRPGALGIGRGEIETLLAACLFSFQILTLENPRFAENRGRPVTLVMCVGIAAFFLPTALLTAPTPGMVLTAGASWPALLLIIVLSVFCTLGAFLLMNTWQRKVPATEAGLIYTTEPLFAAAYALFSPALLSTFLGIRYANESLTMQLLTGGALIFLANIWMQWRRPPHSPAIAPVP